GDPPDDDGGSPLLAYLVYRGDGPGGESLLAGVGLVTSWIDITVTNGHTYYYEVVATNLIGNSDPSNEASATPNPPATPPDPPQGLTATAGDGTVDLAWSAPGSDGGAPITNYKVYRGTSHDGETPLADAGPVLAYTDTSVNNGQTYYYQVTAENSAGEGPRSNEASATPNAPATPPTQPQNLAATPGDGHVDLTWDPPANDGGLPILEYRVYRGTTSNQESFLASAGLSLTYTDSSVTTGNTYSYKVSAVNSVNEGPLSNEASATPAAPHTAPGAPRDLVATAGDASVSLSWSPPSSDGGAPITNYKIYRGTVSGGQLSLIATVRDVRSYTDSPLTNGKSYYYKVTALNEVGEGQASKEASATPVSGQTVPSPPRSLSAAAGDARVTLGWLAPSSDGGSPITNYTIYRGTSSSGKILLTTLGNVSAY